MTPPSVPPSWRPVPDPSAAADIGALVAAAKVLSIPMTTQFRGITVRETMLISGPAGWGEFGPFAEYDAQECVPWWQSACEAALTGWPAPVRDRVPVNVTIPAVGPDQAAAIAAVGGCRTAKVKVAERGQAESDDLARVEAVRAALGPSGRIRVDANGAWDVDTAVTRLRHLDRAAGGLEYAEQPCPTVEELAAVRRRVDVLIAADESVRRAHDPLRVVRLQAADVLVLKVAPLGGVTACLRLAEECGLPVVVSSALETSVGLAAGVALAAALPTLPYACGLATGQLLTTDVTPEPLLPVAGFLHVHPVLPATGRLAELAAEPDRAEWWRKRIRSVREVEGE